MAAEVTQAWLKANVGEPSDKWGSTYTAIYKATGDYERNKNEANLGKVFDLLLKFSRSKHKHATTDAARADKDRQQRELNLFFTAVQIAFQKMNANWKYYLQMKVDKDQADYPKELAYAREVIEEMCGSSVALVSNTGLGLRDGVIVMVFKENENGAFRSDGVLEINPALTYNKSLLIGVLVHEYHHKLCKHNGTYTYLDEFVAHWKQWSVTRPPAGEAAWVAEINERLERLYKNQVAGWTKQGNRLVVKLDDVGDFLVLDNARVKPQSACKHGCKAA